MGRKKAELTEIMDEVVSISEDDREKLFEFLEAEGMDYIVDKINSLYRYRERLEGAMLAGNIAWWEMQLPSGGVEFHPRKTEMIGYNPDDFNHYSDFTDLLHPDDYPRAMQAMRDHLEGEKERYEVEYRFKKSSGEYHWFYDVGGIIWQEGEEKRLVGVVVDINEYKDLRIKLSEALEEKDLLLKELFHRLKNDLQMVASMLSLEGRSTDNKESADLLFDGSSRVKILSKMYDDFLAHENKLTINLEDYLKKLAKELVDLYRSGVKEIKLDFEVSGETDISYDIAAKCGLILNELLTNSFKYGANESGVVKVEIHLDNRKDKFKMKVTDNGPGFADDFSVDELDSFGMQIVKSLVEQQLDGVFEINGTGGATFSVTFPVS